MASLQSIHLYHIPGFRSTRVLWLYLELQKLYENKLGFTLPSLIVQEFKDVTKFRNEKSKFYLEDCNPNGKVPTLVDPNKDVVMWESCACCLYLLETYDIDGVMLDRVNPKERSLYHQLAFYSSGTLDNLTSTSSPVQRAVLALQQGPANMKVVLKKENKVAWDTIIAPYYEQLLLQNGGPYLVGQNFKAIDVIFGHDLYGLHEKLIARGGGKSWLNREMHPQLCAYHERISERDAYKIAFAQTDTWPQTLFDSGRVTCVAASLWK
mmetsp:Transcript_11456/g.14930  ORF Transcript_11456/g.14930 Transcript_11456/m.14930 type:complete len:266 (+) Transcript_11456:59-856(+)